MTLHVSIDQERCQGSGSCVFHAPATFDQRDDGTVVLLDTRDPDQALRAAAEACPTRAITVTEMENP